MTTSASASAASVRHNEAQSRFEIDAGVELGVTQYIRKGDKIVFTHTEVPADAEGQGLGNALAEAALDYAEREHLLVVPRCQFVAAYIGRHPKYQHLVDEKLHNAED
ncbi:MAG: GNAT family N-acetyltransferase [Gemmatimonadaceae bacterium]